MKYVKKYATPALVLVMMSACSPRETPKTVSDFCLNDRSVPFSVADVAHGDDPGNKFDTEATINDLIEHNRVYRKLCN